MHILAKVGRDATSIFLQRNIGDVLMVSAITSPIIIGKVAQYDFACATAVAVMIFVFLFSVRRLAAVFTEALR